MDTGSSNTLIQRPVAIRCQVQMVEEEKLELRGFTGVGTSSSLFARVTVKIMEATAKVRAIIVEDDAMHYEAIIGRDFLDQTHVMLIKRQDKVIIRELPRIERTLRDIADVCTTTIGIDQLTFGDVDDISRKDCEELIKEYADCTSATMQTLGKTSTVEMEIRCTVDTPVCYHPYRMAEIEREIARKIINELLENNIVRESRSPYASPITLVKKKTGDYRICVDYRRLNAITVKDKYPLPLVEDQVDRLGGNKYYTALDLTLGYYQVPMSVDSIE